jgi:hypothetical protein
MNVQDLKITIEGLSVQEVNAVLAGLQELPGKICNPLSKKITEQAETQVAIFQAANKPPAPPEPPPAE